VRTGSCLLGDADCDSHAIAPGKAGGAAHFNAAHTERHLNCETHLFEHRYLVETPANICTPQYLAETAGRIAALAPERFHLDVHERAAVEKLGMGLYLGVAEVRPLWGFEGFSVLRADIVEVRLHLCGC